MKLNKILLVTGLVVSEITVSSVFSSAKATIQYHELDYNFGSAMGSFAYDDSFVTPPASLSIYTTSDLKYLTSFNLTFKGLPDSPGTKIFSKTNLTVWNIAVDGHLNDYGFNLSALMVIAIASPPLGL